MSSHTTAVIAAGFAGALALTATAHAADDAGLYGGINLGRSHLDLSGGNIDSRLAGQGVTASSTAEQRDTAWSLVGGYRFNHHWATEASYVDLGRFGYKSTATAPAAGNITGDYRFSGYGLSGVGILPLQSGFSIYAKAGLLLARTEIDASASGGLPATSASNRSTNGTYGLGVSYDITKSIAARAEWNRYARVGDSNTGRSDIDMVSMGLAYKF
jgi:OmpA-OmpF porin, OOP family